MHTLMSVFNGDVSDVTEVRIEADMDGADVWRRTRLFRGDIEIVASEPTPTRRAGR